MRARLGIVVMCFLLNGCQQPSPSQKDVSGFPDGKNCVDIAAPADLLGTDWRLSINVTSESPSEPLQIVTDDQRGPFSKIDLQILLGLAQENGPVKACNFDYIRDSEDGHKEHTVNTFVFSSPIEAQAFYEEHLSRWETRSYAQLSPGPGDHGTFFESKGLNKAFVQRGVVYFVTESISSGDSMRTLATVLDEHIEAGLPSQGPASD